jgi:hypothetical protein
MPHGTADGGGDLDAGIAPRANCWPGISPYRDFFFLEIIMESFLLLIF